MAGKGVGGDAKLVGATDVDGRGLNGHGGWVREKAEVWVACGEEEIRMNWYISCVTSGSGG